jgi:hypothetical protein
MDRCTLDLNLDGNLPKTAPQSIDVAIVLSLFISKKLELVHTTIDVVDLRLDGSAELLENLAYRGRVLFGSRGQLARQALGSVLLTTVQ